MPGWGRSPGGRHGNPLQYSYLEDPWTEESGVLQSIGSHRVGHDWSDLAQNKNLSGQHKNYFNALLKKQSFGTERLHFHFSPSCIGEGNGNPLQYSCLENPMDRGAWWAIVHTVRVKCNLVTKEQQKTITAGEVYCLNNTTDWWL